MATKTTGLNQVKEHQFWSERCFALKSIALPQHVAKRVGRSTTWSIEDVIGELLRKPGHCPHVTDPQPPVPIFGLEPDRLPGLVKDLAKLAWQQRVPRMRLGKQEYTRQKLSTPTLMSCTASMPIAGVPDQSQRVRWEQLVINACKRRFGRRLVAVVAHVDEAHYHLHILVHNDGRSVKELQHGHAAAKDWEQLGDLTGGDLKTAGDAYRAGGRVAQDWYWSEVGQYMGWERKAAAPRPRLPRGEYLQQREAEIAKSETVIEERKRELQVEAEEIESQRAELARAQELFQSRLDALVEAETEAATTWAIETEARERSALEGLVEPPAPKSRWVPPWRRR